MFCIDLTVPVEMYLRCMSTCKILFLFQRSQFPILYILVHCMCKCLMIKFWDLILTNSVCMYKCTCTVYLCRPLSKIFYSNMSVNMYREKNKLFKVLSHDLSFFITNLVAFACVIHVKQVFNLQN